jgi:4-amino-4-deoxychorismate lyase
VLSADVIERYIDPATNRLHTIRLLLKKSKLPTAVVKLLPASIIGSQAVNGSQTYILEESVVDVEKGWMETSSRNLEWTGVLSVMEKQVYQKSAIASQGVQSLSVKSSDHTDVTTTVTLLSRFGQVRRKAQRTGAEAEQDREPKVGFFKSFSTSSIQRSIEAIGVRRAREQLLKSREGMQLIMERIRKGGLAEVVDSIRRDREVNGAGAGGGLWKQNWSSSSSSDSDDVD